MRFALIILVAYLAFHTVAFAQSENQQQVNETASTSILYQWTDDKGNVHVTDNLGNVPERYRSKARKLEKATGNEGYSEQKMQEVSGSSASQVQEGMDDEKKTEWQQRMKEARQRLADAEKRYRELDQKRNELLGAWGGVASGRLDDRMQAQQLEQEMQQVQQEIEKAQNEVQNVIPEQARKAGVPPGWLRE